MAMTATLNKRSKTSGTMLAKFTLVASGNYATNGDSVDFGAKAGYLGVKPDVVDIYGITGFTYSYDLVNKKVLAFAVTSSGANVPMGQVSAGAYPAGITGDTITAYCIWMATPFTNVV